MLKKEIGYLNFNTKQLNNAISSLSIKHEIYILKMTNFFFNFLQAKSPKYPIDYNNNPHYHNPQYHKYHHNKNRVTRLDWIGTLLARL